MTKHINIHSVESLGALDGPGLRTVVFLTGCPLRCQYCHNPDTWMLGSGIDYSYEELISQVLKMKPYFKNGGGVTFSGGEPLMQSDVLIPIAKRLKSEGIHIALDTAGVLWNDSIKALLQLVDLVLLDVKHTDHTTFTELTKGTLDDTLFFLEQLKKYQKPYWIRQVIVPTINNVQQQVLTLEKMTRSPLREKIELLPFHKTGLYKWHALGLACPLEKIPEPTTSEMYLLSALISDTDHRGRLSS